MESRFQIPGFLGSAPKTASGKPQLGRFACQDIQWTGSGDDVFGTFTITAGELLTCAEGNLLWTDQDVQRGIRPEISHADRELSLAFGYPDSETYIFDTSKADEITQKLLRGDKLFLNSLIWNLRPGQFSAYYDSSIDTFYIYSGKIYLPDSHHRHQAIIKAAQIARDHPRSYRNFDLSKEFKVELYFLTKESEGDYFFAKNQLPKPTAKSKAFDLTSQDDLSLLAKKFAENSRSLTDNVNRVTDRLAANNSDVVTLSTLREMMRTYAGDTVVSKVEADGIAAIAAEFYDLLASIRPELGRLDLADRVTSRSSLLVDAAVMMHGYAYLMRDYREELSRVGSLRAKQEWQTKLKKLSYPYQSGGWSGDFFSKQNPLWLRAGILRQKADGSGYSVVNNGSTRSVAGRLLRGVVNAQVAAS